MVTKGKAQMRLHPKIGQDVLNKNLLISNPNIFKKGKLKKIGFWEIAIF